MKLKKRRVINCGLFSPKLVKGRKITNPIMLKIYNKLKSQGFRETPWQIIYNDQIAGLVLPHRDGKNEIHIRFFKDRIFAEFEIGRAYLSHFICKRCNANNYIIQKFRNILTKKERAYLRKNFLEENHKQQEYDMAVWDCKSDLYDSVRVTERAIWGAVALFSLIDTKAFAAVIILFTLFLSISFTNSSVFISLIIAGISAGISYRILPSKGNP